MVQTRFPSKNGFPNENVSSKVKEGKDWLLQYCQAVYGSVDSFPDRSLGYRSRDWYRRIRKYALGRQGIQQYKDILMPKMDNDENGINKLVVSDEIIKFIPKLRAIGISLVQKANENYDLTINPIDSQAAFELEEEARELKAKVAVRQALKQNGMDDLAQMPAVAQQPGEPDDLQGAEVYVMGMRHKAAMKSELVVSQILSSNQYNDLREKIAADLFDFGHAVVKDSTDGCYVKLHKVDMRGFVCSPFSSSDGNDELTYVGELREMTVPQLLSEANEQISGEALEKIYKIGESAGSQSTSRGIRDDWRERWGAGRVQVLEIEIRSTDTDYREERTNKYGNPVFGKAKYGAESDEEKGKTVYKKRNQNIYTAKWVVNTDILYDFGRQVNVKIDPNNISQAHFSYHIVTGHNDDMVTYSRTDALIYFADQIQLRRMKLEHLFNTQVPPGYTVDLSAMEEIAMNAGGQNMTPPELLALFRTHGIIPFRSDHLTDGQKTMGLPIQAINMGALGSSLAEYWNDIQNNMALAKETIGLNEVTDGNAPNPKRLNSGTEAAVNGTKNAMSDMFNADRRLMISLARGCLIRAQNLFKIGKGEEFINALGTETVMFLKGLPTIEPYRYGFTIEDRPSPDEIAAFEQEMQKALMENQIDIADAAIIRSIRNIKQRNAYLIYAVRRKAEVMQQQAQANSKQQADLQIQAAQAAEQAKQQTIQVQLQADLERIKAQAEYDLRNGTAIETIRLDGKRIDAAGRTGASWIQASGRDAGNIRDNQAKLLDSDNPNAQLAAPELSIPADLESGITPQTSAENPIAPGVEQLSAQQFSFTAPPDAGGAGEGLPAGDDMMGMEGQMPQEEMGMMEGEQGMMPEEMGEDPMQQGMAPQPQDPAVEGPTEEDIMSMLR